MHWQAVLIFPRLADVGEIERIRRQYDPVYEKVEPHFTLVFPFNSEIPTDELRKHTEEALKGCRRFPVQMQGITGQEGSCLFLNVVRGNDAIIDLHRRLYSGVLAPYRDLHYTFFPHLTVGRFSNEASYKTALESVRTFDTVFETVVDEVAVISIGSGGCCKVEAVVRLGRP